MNSIIVSERGAFLTASGELAYRPMTFLEMLAEAGMTKKDLANELGICRENISRWGESPQPYAVAYLEMRLENEALYQVCFPD